MKDVLTPVGIVLLLLSALLYSQNQINPRTQIQQPFPNSVIWVTHDQVHTGENVCLLVNSATVFPCSFSNNGHALSTYTLGMPLIVVAHTSCSDACAVNVDQLGDMTLKQADGVTDQVIVNGHIYLFFYDGKVFRIPG